MKEKMFDIGNRVFVDTGRVICILPIMSTSKAMISRAEKQGNLVDVTGKKKKNAVILIEDDKGFISWIQPDTLRKRFDQLVGVTKSDPL